jgi:hypothetical protein
MGAPIQILNTEALTAAIFQVEVFCVVTGYQRFRGPCCLHLHGEVKEETAWSSEIFVTAQNSVRIRAMGVVTFLGCGYRHYNGQMKDLTIS